MLEFEGRGGGGDQLVTRREMNLRLTPVEDDVRELRTDVRRLQLEQRYLFGGLTIAIPIASYALMHVFK